MGHIFWISLLWGITSTLGGGLLSLVVAHAETLLPLFWLVVGLEGVLMGWGMDRRVGWLTAVRMVLAFVVPVGAGWLGGVVGVVPAVSVMALLWLCGFSWGMMLVLWWAFSRKPRVFSYLLLGQPADSTLPYEKWAAEEIARMNFSPSLEGIERLFFWLLLLSLVVSGLAVLVRPATEGYMTAGWLVLFVGFWGSRAFLHEQSQLLDWRMQGLSLEQAKRTIPHALVLVVLLVCLGVGFVLPHRFVVVSLEALGERFRESVTQTEVQLKTAPQNEPSVVEEQTPSSGESTSVTSTRFSGVAVWVIRILGILVAVYLLVGLVGYLLERFLSYKPKNALVLWFIRFYERNKTVFQFLGFVLMLVWSVVSTITGITLLKKAIEKRQRTTSESEALRQQLYALFENTGAQSDEKKEEIMTIVRYFVLLIETASSRILPYRPSYGPLEYIEKLIANIPSLRESLLWIVSVFNESRYSLHLLPAEKRETFAQTVNTVIGELSK